VEAVPNAVEAVPNAVAVAPSAVVAVQSAVVAVQSVVVAQNAVVAPSAVVVAHTEALVPNEEWVAQLCALALRLCQAELVYRFAQAGRSFPDDHFVQASPGVPVAENVLQLKEDCRYCLALPVPALCVPAGQPLPWDAFQLRLKTTFPSAPWAVDHVHARLENDEVRRQVERPGSALLRQSVAPAIRLRE
jgi:hypothetical protein